MAHGQERLAHCQHERLPGVLCSPSRSKRPDGAGAFQRLKVFERRVRRFRFQRLPAQRGFQEQTTEQTKEARFHQDRDDAGSVWVSPPSVKPMHAEKKRTRRLRRTRQKWRDRARARSSAAAGLGWRVKAVVGTDQGKTNPCASRNNRAGSPSKQSVLQGGMELPTHREHYPDEECLHDKA